VSHQTQNAAALDAFVRTLETVQETERNNTRSAGVDYACRAMVRDHGQVLLSLMDPSIQAFCSGDVLAGATERQNRILALVSRVACLSRDAGEIGPGMLASLVDEARAIVGEPT